MAATVWDARPAVIRFRRRRRLRLAARFLWWVVVPVLLAFAFALAGCDGAVRPGRPEAGWDVAARCHDTCSPGTVAAAGWDRCECFPPEGACAVDRLLVTPIPPGSKRPAPAVVAEKGGGR